MYTALKTVEATTIAYRKVKSWSKYTAGTMWTATATVAVETESMAAVFGVVMVVGGEIGGLLSNSIHIHICRLKATRERAYRKRNKDAAPRCWSQLPTSSAVTLLFRITFKHTHTHTHKQKHETSKQPVCVLRMYVWFVGGGPYVCTDILMYIFHTLNIHARSFIYICMHVWKSIFLINTCMHSSTCIDMFIFCFSIYFILFFFCIEHTVSQDCILAPLSSLTFAASTVLSTIK